MNPVFTIKDLNAHYGAKAALKNITLDIPPRSVTAIIGASGCGKSTFLRCLNRMNDLTADFRLTGEVRYNSDNIYDRHIDVIDIRKQVGMVFQRPNVFPKSIYENVAYGLRIQGIKRKALLDEVVQKSLIDAALWEEVSGRLSGSALRLSGGQQQRLCIARTLAIKPRVLLFDEPCSALDPLSSKKIEQLIIELKSEYDIVVVTHNMQQAKRIADYVGFFHLGELVEFGATDTIFSKPQHSLTNEYVQGGFG